MPYTYDPDNNLVWQDEEVVTLGSKQSQTDQIKNALAADGIYNSPDGKWAVIGGGDANTPNLPSAFAGEPRIITSAGANVPSEISSAYPAAPQGENQHFQQQKAQYEAGEGKPTSIGEAALAAVAMYAGGSALGGFLGAGETLGGATYLGGDAMAASGIGAGGVTGAEVAGATGAAATAGAGAVAGEGAPVVDMSTVYDPASQASATSYPVSTPPTTQDLNATDITNSVPPQGYSNLAGEAGTFDPTTPQPMPETPNMGNSTIDPNELAAGTGLI